MDNWKLPTSSELPCEMGRYVLHEQIGRGGTATVYSAELFGPAGFRKLVALKMMHADGRTEFDTEETGLLVREARLGGLLQHPHIVDVYELGAHEGVPFMAMELVKGPTLG